MIPEIFKKKFKELFFRNITISLIVISGIYFLSDTGKTAFLSFFYKILDYLKE